MRYLTELFNSGEGWAKRSKNLHKFYAKFKFKKSNFLVFDSNGKRPNGMMSVFTQYCTFLSHISQAPCPNFFEDWNVPAGRVHAEGRLKVKS